MPSSDPKRIEALLLLAKSRPVRPRRWRFTAGFLVAGLLLLILVFVVWSFWPTAELPPLALSLYDQVARPQEAVMLCAQVEPLGGDYPAAKLSGCVLAFAEPSSALAENAVTDEQGRAFLKHSFAPSERSLELEVRYAGEKGRRGAQARGRVFLCPPEAAFLFVDADHALADTEPEKLWTANNLDIPPVPGVGAALSSLEGKYRIAYLSAKADRPSRYNKLRAWLERAAVSPRERFPDGPVLAMGGKPGGPDAATFLRQTITDLRQAFGGLASGLTNDPVTAQVFQSAGLRTFLLGDMASPSPEIITLRTPADLVQRLAE